MTRILRLDARSTIAGNNQVVNVFHVQTGDNLTLPEANALLAPFKTFYDAWAADRTTGANFVIGTRVTSWLQQWWTKPVKNSSGQVVTPGHFNTAPDIYGCTAQTSVLGSAGAAIPPQLACVLSWKTASAGRSYRGRTYLGMLGAAAQTTSVIASATVARLNTAAAALLTGLSAVTVASGTAYLGLWSPTLGESRAIIAGSTDQTWDTMRSRVK